MILLYKSFLHSVLVTQVEGASLMWEVLKHGGPASVALFLFVAWWLERRDHKLERDANRELQEKVMEMNGAVIEHMIKSEAALQSLSALVTKLL